MVSCNASDAGNASLAPYHSCIWQEARPDPMLSKLLAKTPALARVSGQFCSERLVGAGVLVLVRHKWPHFSSRKYIDHGPFDCEGELFRKTIDAGPLSCSYLA